MGISTHLPLGKIGFPPPISTVTSVFQDPLSKGPSRKRHSTYNFPLGPLSMYLPFLPSVSGAVCSCPFTGGPMDVLKLRGVLFALFPHVGYSMGGCQL